jgi:hypothetical protein
VRSFEERWDEIKEDPKKLKRLFTVIWVISYSMLILGFVIILALFISEM